ncbi:hypothetical protein JTB14_035705 [Gonioctena quinquepunctata]|nr:hypothetical protein JTB14_035705 [Gonioctena quinquepunctata]
MKVVILPKNYPEITLRVKELSTFENAIVRKMALGTKCKLGEIHFCSPCLGTWKGAQLMMCLADETADPSRHTKRGDVHPIVEALGSKEKSNALEFCEAIKKMKDEKGDEETPKSGKTSTLTTPEETVTSVLNRQMH